VRVTLHDLSSEEMLRGLGDGKLNLCLMVQPSARALRGLKFEVLREYPACVAVPFSHSLARVKQVKLEQIVSEPFVAYDRADYPEYHAMLEELFGATGQKPRVVEEHGSAPGLVAAVEIGRGVAIVPSCMGMLTGSRLKLVPLHPAPQPLRVGAAYDSKHLSLAAGKFLAAARVAGAGRQSRLGRS
jgi:DNA-binding transcriptional LysR family regulator